MAKKKKRGKPKMTIPIAPVLGLAKGLVFPFGNNIERAQQGDFIGIADAVMAGYTGYSIVDRNFDLMRLQEGLLPLVVGMGAHWVASKMGINRLLGRMGVPLIRI